ncbi:MAG: flagellar biosynthetic protein [Sphingomonadales bacterium]|jgi:flagellar assembly protein FliH|nr:flagellar biosynthetic protein [Sphingomonadales bacterium]MBK9004758.1 flagellar biosynthetic protein [Sphingomonadales bacterium]MBK9267515.1 flagellar biosynthetic protein [Sphingomonadales bacterium]MBP6434443.1 flagellar biosynthetic protein [Sphingorhabdus sp.]
MSEAGFVPLVDPASEASGSFRIWAEPVGRITEEPADQYARGLAEGQMLAETAFAEERGRLLALVAAANALQPLEPEAVRRLICTTVERLVREIAGAAPIDPDHLRHQVDEATQLAGNSGNDAVLRLSPEDAALLADADIHLPIIPDALLPPGTLRLESDTCTIEHGRAVQLEALGLQLGHGEGRP